MANFPELHQTVREVQTIEQANDALEAIDERASRALIMSAKVLKAVKEDSAPRIIPVRKDEDSELPIVRSYN